MTGLRRWGTGALVAAGVAALAVCTPSEGAAAVPGRSAPTAVERAVPPVPPTDPGTPAPQPQPQPAPAPPAVAPPGPGTPDPRARAREVLAEQQRVQERAARRQVDEQLTGARRSGPTSPEQRARESWESHDRPARMVIVRSASVDLVTDGQLTRRLGRGPGAVTLPALDRALPPAWLSITDGVARLSAAVVLTPGTVLSVERDVRTLQLTGGPTPSDAASLYTGGGRLVLRGVAVASADPTTGQPLPPGPGRPFVVASRGGRLDATDVTLTGLGTPVESDGRAGLGFNDGSSGSLVRVSVLRGSTGLKLDGSQDVRLEALTVADSVEDGLVLQGDRGTVLDAVSAERNGGNGVLVSGTSTDRPISAITAAGNGAYGVAVVGQTGARVTGITTSGNGVGGLRLGRSGDVLVADSTTTDEPIGVFTHIGSTRIVLDRLRVTGGRRGVVFEKSTTDSELTASAIDRTRVAGIAVGARGISLRDVTVTDFRAGLRIERGTHGFTATRLSLADGQDGVIAVAGTDGVLLQDLRVDGVDQDAVRTSSSGIRIVGGSLTDATTGIDAMAATTVSGTAIGEVDIGVMGRSDGLVLAEALDVSAVTAGMDAAAGTPFVLRASRIDALQAVRGEVRLEGPNELSLPPLNLLGAVGVPLILLALALERIQAHRLRSAGGVRRRPPPVLPVGAA